MIFISFIYRVGKNPKTYYGKYCTDCISDDDYSGIDIQVVDILKKGLNLYRKKNNIPKPRKPPKIIVGILSFSSSQYFPIHSSKKEIPCFDFYHDYDNKIYINGSLLSDI
jgi:hypothetical protein